MADHTCDQKKTDNVTGTQRIGDEMVVYKNLKCSVCGRLTGRKILKRKKIK